MTRMITLIRKVTARHFRAGGMDVTADQLADQIIASMRAVANGQASAHDDGMKRLFPAR